MTRLLRNGTAKRFSEYAQPYKAEESRLVRVILRQNIVLKKELLHI